MIESGSIVTGEGVVRRDFRGAGGNYLDCGNSFTGVYIYVLKFIKLYTIYNSFYVSEAIYVSVHLHVCARVFPFLQIKNISSLETKDFLFYQLLNSHHLELSLTLSKCSVNICLKINKCKK